MSASLVAVFIPLLLMGGMVGRLFREFSVTLSAAILVSLLVSLTTTPMMCAALLRPEKGRAHGRVYRASEWVFELMRHTYEVSLGWALRHSRFMLFLTLLTVVVNIGLFIYIPKGFFPEQDIGRITGVIQASQDISFQAMREKLKEVVDVIKTDPDVTDVLGFSGGPGGGGSTTNTARMFISLKPFEERQATARQVIARLRRKLAQVPGAPTFLQPVQDLRIGGFASAALYQFTLRGDNLEDLNAWGPRVLQKMRTLPELTDVNSDQQDKGLQSSLVIDRDTASRVGLTAQLIDDTLYDAFGQRQVSITYTPLNQYHVVMEVAPPYWQRPETLRQIYVHSSRGAEVPLSAFTHYQPTTTPLSVNHLGQFPAVTTSFNLARGAALGDAVVGIESAMIEMGLPASIRGTFVGTAEGLQGLIGQRAVSAPGGAPGGLYRAGNSI
jgi:multidrug efflux pump